MKKKQKDKLEHSCVICGHTSLPTASTNAVEFQTNPFASEINSDKAEDWYCHSCICNLQEEI